MFDFMKQRDLPAYACRIYVILPRASFRFAVARETLASG